MLTHTLGFPRIGANRELKTITELFWNKNISESDYLVKAMELCRKNWMLQKNQGIDLIPTGDFSLYDHILDITCLLGAVPERFDAPLSGVNTETYFRMARGDSSTVPMEMTKWFDTNYHYIVPEFTQGMSFKISKYPFASYLDEAVKSGINAKAVITGPVTYMSLGKSACNGFDKWDMFDKLICAYCDIIALYSQRCEWIQLDEPMLAADLSVKESEYYIEAYKHLANEAGKSKLMIATYFGGVEHNKEIIKNLPVDCIHLDIVNGQGQAEKIISAIPSKTSVSLGIVDGCNIWRTDMEKAASLIRKIIEITGTERVMVSSSCSLMHVPVDVNCENDLDSEIRPWLSFAVQKCGEIRTIADAVSGDAEACRKALKSKGLVESRKKSAILNNKIVRDRTNNISAGMLQRKSLYSIRRLKQKNKLNLPPFPTTTIGSFPQTAAIRKARKNFKNGVIDSAEYDRVIREYITDSIRRQESIGLDVLVHGEPERNDMVEYFGEMMDGVCITGNGWVQSYGTRCVKPPVIFGDVSRKKPWTKEYTNFAQSLTGKPVKGILTGPVTILSWSFVRDDQPRRITCTQIALAIRDEVLCLEESGAPIIQIDEPAFREDSPLRKIDRQEYYEWASACFRLASSGVKDETQIHTHMCYCEFNDAIEEIASLDADVISIEASRSNMDILIPLTAFGYPNEIGPGVYDIHSPRVPGIGEIAVLIKKASEKIPQERLWINPDCGLKTRKWEEAEPALRNMVEAARLACSI